MNFDFSAMNLVICKDTTILKRLPEIKEGILHCGKALNIDRLRKSVFMKENYTALFFPQKNVGGTEKQIQTMNYQHCVQTMAELMKKYAPEILN